MLAPICNAFWSSSTWYLNDPWNGIELECICSDVVVIGHTLSHQAVLLFMALMTFNPPINDLHSSYLGIKFRLKRNFKMNLSLVFRLLSIHSYYYTASTDPLLLLWILSSRITRICLWILPPFLTFPVLERWVCLQLNRRAEEESCMRWEEHSLSCVPESRKERSFSFSLHYLELCSFIPTYPLIFILMTRIACN